jgi:hypothetical protein
VREGVTTVDEVLQNTKDEAVAVAGHQAVDTVTT